MSGNVREWCWNWYGDLDSESGSYRAVKGSGQRPSRTLFFVLGCRCSNLKSQSNTLFSADKERDLEAKKYFGHVE